MKTFCTKFTEHLQKIIKRYPAAVPPSLEKKAQELCKEIEEAAKTAELLIKKPLNGINLKKLKDHQTVLRLEIAHLGFKLQELSEVLLDASLNIIGPPIKAAADDPEDHCELKVFKKFTFPIFTMEQCGEHIIIQEGGCIKIFNQSLEVIKTSCIFRNLYSDKIIKNFNETEILLIDLNNKIFVHMTLHDGSYSLINAPQLEENELILLYWWEDKEAIIRLNDNRLLAIDLISRTVKEIDTSYKTKHYHNFYSFCEFANNYERIVWMDPHSYRFTFLDRDTMTGGFVNWLTKEEKIIYNIDYDIFTLYYKEPDLFLIGTEIVQRTDGTTPVTTILRSMGDYRITGLRGFNQFPRLFVVSCKGPNIMAEVGGVIVYTSR